MPLTPVRQKGGKLVMAWAFRGESPTRYASPQYVHDGMAAALGQDAAVSRDRLRGVLHRRRGAPETESRAGGVRRRAGATRRGGGVQIAGAAEGRALLRKLRGPGVSPGARNRAIMSHGSRTPRPTARMEAVQTPVIPIVAHWIRSTPGTISLGQGIVSYGPPRESLEALRTFGGASRIIATARSKGCRSSSRRLDTKLRRENGIATDRRRAASSSRRAATWAF